MNWQLSIGLGKDIKYLTATIPTCLLNTFLFCWWLNGKTSLKKQLKLILHGSACCVTSCFFPLSCLPVCEMYAVWHQVRLHQKKGLFCFSQLNLIHMQVEHKNMRLVKCCEAWGFDSPTWLLFIYFGTLRALWWLFFL